MIAAIILAATVWGYCPGAELRQTGWGSGIEGIPAKEQVRARKALNECRKAGIKVPYTVAEYNKRPRKDLTPDELHLLKQLAMKPGGEF
ncbi:MAG: hypothetical protein BGP16_00950 [Sphingobium sp. 66-54]|nr:MAG: hypothetical protein BGP16_00950 [Sphingobium sp. 66-54]